MPRPDETRPWEFGDAFDLDIVGTVMNGVPLPDFGKGHPDPNPIWAKPLVDLVMGPDAPDLGAYERGKPLPLYGPRAR